MPIQDPTAGFVCYKRTVLENIDLDKVRFVGYAFQIGMKYLAYKLDSNSKKSPLFAEVNLVSARCILGLSGKLFLSATIESKFFLE
jgi:dolichol-phosphate mannosyltransferase